VREQRRGSVNQDGIELHQREVDKARAFEGRPFRDPRNKFSMPAYNAGVPRRDLDVSPIRVGVFDIEATGLNASFSRMLCVAIHKFAPNERIILRADEYPGWKEGKRASDRELVLDTLKAIDDVDILIAHNGVQYDMPFIRTRALIHGLPPVHPKKIVDPVFLARKVFKFHSNALDAISVTLGTDVQKTKIPPQVWMAAIGDGDKEAMDYIVDHCIKDVDVLTEIAHRFMPYVREINALGSDRM
jgi:uncharacterized protein YprB with RNaseH-like and TPR domain